MANINKAFILLSILLAPSIVIAKRVPEKSEKSTKNDEPKIRMASRSIKLGEPMVRTMPSESTKKDEPKIRIAAKSIKLGEPMIRPMKKDEPEIRMASKSIKLGEPMIRTGGSKSIDKDEAKIRMAMKSVEKHQQEFRMASKSIEKQKPPEIRMASKSIEKEKPPEIRMASKSSPKVGHSDGKDKINSSTTCKVDFETDFVGYWFVHNPNVGVSAMQLQLMPNNKAVWFDTTSLGPSARKLDPPGNCPISFEMGTPDCYAHGLSYDITSGSARTLKMDGDPWCSSGGLGPSGELIGTGGNRKGNRDVRILDPCDMCEFKERHDALGVGRWYASQQILEDGNLVVVGGRGSFSYDLMPPALDFTPKVINLPFLQQTTDPPIPNTNGPPVENNLYPFLYLAPDGNIFIFANNRAILFNPWTGQTVREYPVLTGGSRNYPPSGMSALLPLKLCLDNPEKVEAEVVVCGGNSPNAFGVVDSKHTHDKVFMPALQDCWRLKILEPNAQWVREQDMPSRRTMGDLLHLPTGDLLFINGAKSGTSGWEDAIDPNLTPTLYRPHKPMGQRFCELEPTTVPRMYHSSSALLPEGKILVAGSNPHSGYTYTGDFFTDLRVEKFAPHYEDPELDVHRPHIMNNSATEGALKYGQKFSLNFDISPDDLAGLAIGDLKITMIAPPFTTHGFSQNQRLIIPALESLEIIPPEKRGSFAPGIVRAVAPANGKIAPPGYYMLFLVHLGVPSSAMWVHINN